MQRFNDQPLSDKPHIAVLGANKIGNFVVCTPLLRGLREKYPNVVIDYFGSEATRDFEEQSKLIDWRISWDGSGAILSELGEALTMRNHQHGPYELAINCDGFNEVTQVLTPMLRPKYVAGGSFDAKLRELMPWGDEPNQRFMGESDWDSEQFIERHRHEFNSNYIGELICRMAYVQTDYTKLELPVGNAPFDVPDILVHCTTTRAAKIWPMQHWLKVLQFCDAKGLTTGLIGSPAPIQNEMYHGNGSEDELLEKTQLIDLRGQTSLYQLAGACTLAKAMITVDAGPLHIGAAVGCKTLAIFGNDSKGYGASPVRLWLPRMENVSRTNATITCGECAKNRFKNTDCLRSSHDCMLSVAPKEVIDWITDTAL